mmetsp:Transcript_101651/g.178932  ORF Transcript_101651/g.178932 Transcript_101651/m.178932 type:complete len:243 (-) Transcript_101651:685-1413(-)
MGILEHFFVLFELLHKLFALALRERFPSCIFSGDAIPVTCAKTLLTLKKLIVLGIKVLVQRDLYNFCLLSCSCCLCCLLSRLLLLCFRGQLSLACRLGHEHLWITHLDLGCSRAPVVDLDTQGWQCLISQCIAHAQNLLAQLNCTAVSTTLLDCIDGFLSQRVAELTEGLSNFQRRSSAPSCTARCSARIACSRCCDAKCTHDSRIITRNAGKQSATAANFRHLVHVYICCPNNLLKGLDSS